MRTLRVGRHQGQADADRHRRDRRDRERAKIVGLRADIDALPITEATGLPYSSTLPDVSHACGHDVHLTVLLGAARRWPGRVDLGGRVRLIFQPAEEVFPGGSHDVIAAGGLDGLSRLFALHCDPRLEAGLVGLKAGRHHLHVGCR